MKKQLLNSCDSFYASIAQKATKHQLLSTMQSDKKRKHLHNQENIGVSTELTLSCEFSTYTKKPRISDIYSSTHNNQSFSAKKHVSTELKLFDETWMVHFPSASRKESDDIYEESMNSELKAMVQYSANEIILSPESERNKRLKHTIQTELVLYDPWKIKKRLTGSDIRNLCRLLVGSDSVKNHILPFLSTETVEKIKKEGAQVALWDCDTNTEQNTVLKYWHSSKSYVFIKGWRNNFVKRRNLVEGDLIGIYWDPSEDIFKISVLERAYEIHP